MINLLWKDCKELWNDKKRIGFILFVLIILVIGTYYNAINQKNVENNKIQFGVIDEDNSSYSNLLLEYFGKSESFSSYINIVKGSKQNLEQDFNNGRLDVLVTIPGGFAENMIYLKHLPVKVLIDSKDTTKAILLKNILESYEKYIRAVEVNCVSLYDSMSLSGFKDDYMQQKNIEVSYNLIFTALNKQEFFAYEEVNDYPTTNVLNYYIFDFITLFLLYFGLNVGYQMIKERRQGTLKRLYSAGVPIPIVLLEKILFTSSIAVLLILAATLITGKFTGNPVNLKWIIFVITGAFFCTSFSIMLSSLCKNIQSYIITGNSLLFIFCIIGGGIIPVMYLPKTLMALAHFTPNYWMIRIMLLIQSGMNTSLVFLLLTLFIIGFFIFFGISILLCERKGGLNYE